MSDNKGPKKSNGDADVLSWIVTVIMLNVLPPLGVVLLVMQFVGNRFLSRTIASLLQKLKDNKQSAAQSAAQRAAYYPRPNSSSQSRSAQQPQGPQTQGQQPQSGPVRPQPSEPPVRPQAAPQPKPAVHMETKAKNGGKEEKDGVSRISKGKGVMFVFGWVLLALGVLCIIEPLGNGAVWQAMQWLAIALGGGGLLAAGWNKGKKEKLYQNCVKIVGDKASIELNALASAAGVKAKALEKELDEMVDRGYFGADAYYDKARDLLIIDREKAEKHLYQAAQESVDGKDKYDLLMIELARTVERIDDPEMRDKANQIRGLTGAIFSAVREEPDKQDKIGSFLSYYFPTTLKLLDSYGDFEEQGFQGDNLSKSKERIEGAADNIIAAYQKQLDNLYLTNSMDVDSDIDVLETMLKRDGLSDSDFGQPGTM